MFLCSYNKEYKIEIKLQKEAGCGNTSIWVAKTEDCELKASLGFKRSSIFFLKKEYLGINSQGDKDEKLKHVFTLNETM